MSPVLHTVAVTVPGTQTRVLVERLLGSPADACSMAVDALQEVLKAHALRIAVVRSDEVTDVPSSPMETT